MKKLTLILIMMLLVFGLLAGCASNDTGNTDSGNTTDNNTSESKLITVVSREEGSGTRGAFVELMGIEEKGSDGTKVDHTTAEAVIASKTDVVMTNVANDENAIGYISLGSLNDTIKAVEVDGVDATTENIKSGSYKVARPFNIACKEEPTGLAKDFIDFILSAEGQTIASDSYIAVEDNAAAYSGTKPSGKLVVAGSSSVTPLMEKLKESYMEVNPNATIEVQMSDSTSGMTGAIDGTCDIGMASRDLKDSELEKLNYHLPIALDGIAIVVNNNNPVTNISSENVKAIFTGEITDWNEIQ